MNIRKLGVVFIFICTIDGTSPCLFALYPFFLSDKYSFSSYGVIIFSWRTCTFYHVNKIKHNVFAVPASRLLLLLFTSQQWLCCQRNKGILAHESSSFRLSTISTKHEPFHSTSSISCPSAHENKSKFYYKRKHTIGIDSSHFQQRN